MLSALLHSQQHQEEKKIMIIFGLHSFARDVVLLFMHPGTLRSLCIYFSQFVLILLLLLLSFVANSVDVCVCATAYVFANHVFRMFLFFFYYYYSCVLFFFFTSLHLLLLFCLSHLKSIANTISFRILFRMIQVVG